MNIDARGLKFSHNVVLIGIYGWEEFGDSVSGGFLVSAACRGCNLVIFLLLTDWVVDVSEKTIIVTAPKF